MSQEHEYFRNDLLFNKDLTLTVGQPWATGRKAMVCSRSYPESSKMDAKRNIKYLRALISQENTTICMWQTYY